MTTPIALPSVIALGTRKPPQDFQIKYQRDTKRGDPANNPAFPA